MSKFKGIITPIITPFAKEDIPSRAIKKDEIYDRGVVNQISYLYDNSIKNIFICGSYGAFPLLSVEERMEVAEYAIDQAIQLDMKSIVQIGDPSTKIAIELGKHAESIGADAVSAVVPYYYSSTFYGKREFFQYFEDIISNVNLDVHCYNNPGTTGVYITPDILSTLIDLGLMGIKDGSTTIDQMLSMREMIMSKRSDFDYYPSSTSCLLDAFVVGAEACISGISLTVPTLVNAVYNDAIRGRFDLAEEHWKTVMQVRDILGKWRGRPVSAYAALNALGIDVGTCRRPWIPLSQPEIEDLKKEINEVVHEGLCW